jgi:flavin reductase (DIM6/NTAB) family NADH-FMN oxidoreductase RutF
MNKISNGLYVLTARDGKKDNGCIVNAVVFLDAKPSSVIVSIRKENYTHDMVKITGLFNISVLTVETPPKVFNHFGYQSGRDINKFEECETENRASNGVLYVPKFTNSYLSCKVTGVGDFPAHTVFTAEVTETKDLSDKPSITYDYFLSNIKL